MLLALGDLRQAMIGIDIFLIGRERLLKGSTSAGQIAFLQLHASQLEPGDCEFWEQRDRLFKGFLCVVPFALL